MKLNRNDRLGLKRLTAENCIKSSLDGIRRPKGNPYDLDDPWLIRAFPHKIVLSGDWAYARGHIKKIRETSWASSPRGSL